MKILYGVQGTGNGHITRARAMATELKKHPIDVTYVFSGRERDKLFDMDLFGEFRVFRGLTFSAGQGKISPLRTALNNNFPQLLSDIKHLDVDQYDLVLSDFEPVTAWAGWLRKKKVIGIGHQYAFRHAVPRQRASPLQRAILRYFAPASVALGLHWHHFKQPVLPPIAPVEKQLCETARGQYLVYLPFEEPATIRQLLRNHPTYRFRIYHPEITPVKEDHLSWYRLGRRTFQDDLHRCEGVICNAGFELASEVLQLGKKLLVKPVTGQAEQHSNALALELLGYGHTMQTLDSRKLDNWLYTSTSTKIEYPDVAGAICQWVMAGAHGEIEELSANLWRKTYLLRGGL